MTEGIKTVLHPVNDLAAAKAVYAALLGVPPQTDESFYVGFEAADQHIGLVAAVWWPPSPTPMATSSGCFRIDEYGHEDGHVVACAARCRQPRSDRRARRAREQPQGR